VLHHRRLPGPDPDLALRPGDRIILLVQEHRRPGPKDHPPGERPAMHTTDEHRRHRRPAYPFTCRALTACHQPAIQPTAAACSAPVGEDPVDGEDHSEGDEEPPERAADHRSLHVVGELAADRTAGKLAKGELARESPAARSDTARRGRRPRPPS
jgi:hypothetical protein